MDYLEGMILQSNRGNWTLKICSVGIYIYMYIYIIYICIFIYGLQFTGAGSCCSSHKERVITTTFTRASNERVSMIGFSVG